MFSLFWSILLIPHKLKLLWRNLTEQQKFHFPYNLIQFVILSLNLVSIYLELNWTVWYLRACKLSLKFTKTNRILRLENWNKSKLRNLNENEKLNIINILIYHFNLGFKTDFWTLIFLFLFKINNFAFYLLNINETIIQLTFASTRTNEKKLRKINNLYFLW